MPNLHRLTFILVYFFTITLQAQFQISAEVRPRAEIREGYKQMSDTLDSPAFFVSQRSRLALGFSKEKYQVYFAIQDVRVWGDESSYSATGIANDMASIDLKEAWIRLILSDNIALKMGRQELKYADQRIIGGRNWNQHGMSYDAMVLSYEGELSLHAGFSYNNEKELLYQRLYPPDKMKTLNYLFLEKTLNDKLTGRGLNVLSGFEKPESTGRIHFKNTSGILLSYKVSALEMNSSCYYQFGRNREGVKVSAYFWNLSSEFIFSKYSLCVGIDYLSGHNYARTDSSYLKKDHLFDILYGARHRYYGSMDYFSNMPKGTAGGGLMDVYAVSKINIAEKITLQGTYHYFSLQNNVLHPDSGLPMDKSLANELDLSLAFKPMKELIIDIGYSGLISTRTLNSIQQITGDSPEYTHWIWIMCTLKPNLISD